MADVLSEYFTLRKAGHDSEAQALIRSTTELALQNIKSFSFVQICLAALLSSFGIATLVVASENIGFPVFNAGPVLTGILLFLAGGLGFYAAVKGMKLLKPDNAALSSSVRCLIKSNLALSVISVVIATLSAIFAFLSGAACAGADIYFRIEIGNSSKAVDIKEYCSPNRKENSALAFVDGFLCVAVVLWVVVGLCQCCRHASWFGLPKRL